MRTNPAAGTGTRRRAVRLRLLRAEGKPSSRVMDGEEEHDHGIGTLRAHTFVTGW